MGGFSIELTAKGTNPTAVASGGGKMTGNGASVNQTVGGANINY